MLDGVMIVAVGVIGAIFGSFAGATVWRLRRRQLRADAQAGEKVSGAEKRQVAKLQDRPLHSDRSVCLHCGHELRWYDLLPLVSWLQLGGKCRYCRTSIGWFEPLMEIGVATFFVVSYIFWPYGLSSTLELIQFALWLIAGVGLAILFAYDAKWFLLPNRIVFPLIGLGVVYSGIVIATSDFAPSAVSSVVFSCVILSGLYYVIYVVSGGRWVGFGDVKLGLALALFLADWQLAILALFFANLIGTVLLLPLMIIGKVKRQAHVPFGPLLIAGWAVAGLFGATIMQWYTALVLGV